MHTQYAGAHGTHTKVVRRVSKAIYPIKMLPQGILNDMKTSGIWFILFSSMRQPRAALRTRESCVYCLAENLVYTQTKERVFGVCCGIFAEAAFGDSDCVA